MSKRYGYDSYRGRSPLRTFLKALAVVLAVVLVAGVAVLLYLTEQHKVYSTDGVRVDFPWLRRDPDPVESVDILLPGPSEPLVVVTPEVTAPALLHAAALPRAALYDGTAQAQVEAAGANAALFDMKADDGTLGYVSDLPLAEEAKASSSDPAINAAIRALNASELYTVARVSCFRDDALPYHRGDLAVKTNSDYNWRDGGDVRWLSPTSQAARDYVQGVCLELAELGFDEILLDNAAYPTQGTLGYIKKGEAYDQTRFAAVVEGFYADVKATLAADYPEVKLSVMADRTALEEGENPLSGQTAKALAGTAHRVWCADLGPAWSACAQALEEAGLPEARANLIGVDETPGAGGRSWALWFPEAE